MCRAPTGFPLVQPIKIFLHRHCHMMDTGRENDQRNSVMSLRPHMCSIKGWADRGMLFWHQAARKLLIRIRQTISCHLPPSSVCSTFVLPFRVRTHRTRWQASSWWLPMSWAGPDSLAIDDWFLYVFLSAPRVGWHAIHLLKGWQGTVCWAIPQPQRIHQRLLDC